MILFDTETTNLVGAEALDLKNQPGIMEFCAVKLDDKTLVEKAIIDFLVCPPVPITPDAERITGLKASDVNKAPPFVGRVDEIADFFLGERWVVAHNLEFDCSIMEVELRRCGRLTRFPWPPKRLCTVEASFSIEGRRLKLDDLYHHATGGKIQGAHKALNDVRALAVCLRWLKDKKMTPRFL